jgi:hypothetical protein
VKNFLRLHWIKNKGLLRIPMPSVKCSLKSCVYRGKRGSCHRKHIILQQNREILNEMYCLGWELPEMRLLAECASGKLDENDDRYHVNREAE